MRSEDQTAVNRLGPPLRLLGNVVQSVWKYRVKIFIDASATQSRVTDACYLRRGDRAI